MDAEVKNDGKEGDDDAAATCSREPENDSDQAENDDERE
jgi:hypothetical protein